MWKWHVQWVSNTAGWAFTSSRHTGSGIDPCHTGRQTDPCHTGSQMHSWSSFPVHTQETLSTFPIKVQQRIRFVRSLRANFGLQRYGDITPRGWGLGLWFKRQQKEGPLPVELQNCRTVTLIKTITCVEFLENFMFWTIGIQMGNVVNVQDAIAEAADLKVPLGEGLDVLDFQSSIYVNRRVREAAPLPSILLQHHFIHISSTISAASKPTVSRRNVGDGDAPNLRVTETKQECSVGLVFEN